MIEEVQCYRANCDACGEPLTLDGDVQVYFDTKSEILSHMDTCEWGSPSDGHYCPGCWEQK